MQRSFFLHWQGFLAEDNAWITEEDLAHLRPDLLEPLTGTPANSMDSSSSDPERIGVVRPPSLMGSKFALMYVVVVF